MAESSPIGVVRNLQEERNRYLRDVGLEALFKEIAQQLLVSRPSAGADVIGEIKTICDALTGSPPAYSPPRQLQQAGGGGGRWVSPAAAHPPSSAQARPSPTGARPAWGPTPAPPNGAARVRGRGEYSDQVRQVVGQIETLADENEQLRTSMTVAHRGGSHRRVEELQGSGAAPTVIPQVQKMLDGLCADLDEANSRGECLARQLDNTQRELGDVEERCRIAAAHVKQLEELFANSQNRINDLEAELAGERSRMAELEQRNADQYQESITACRLATAAKAKADELADQLAQCKSELAEKHARCSAEELEYRATVEYQAQQIKGMEEGIREKHAMSEELRRAREELAEARDSAKREREAAEKKQATCDHLKSVLAECIKHELQVPPGPTSPPAEGGAAQDAGAAGVHPGELHSRDRRIAELEEELSRRERAAAPAEGSGRAAEPAAPPRLEQQLGALQQELEGLRGAREELLAQLQARAAAVAELEGRLAEREQQRAALEGQLSARSEQLAGQAAELAELRTRAEAAAEAERAARAAQGRAEAAEGSARLLRGELEQSAQLVSAAEERARAAEGSARRMQGELQQAEAGARRLREELDQSGQRSAEAERRAEAAEANAKRLRGELEQSVQRCAEAEEGRSDARRALAEQTAEGSRQRQALEEARRELERARADVAQAGADIALLEATARRHELRATELDRARQRAAADLAAAEERASAAEAEWRAKTEQAEARASAAAAQTAAIRRELDELRAEAERDAAARNQAREVFNASQRKLEEAERDLDDAQRRARDAVEKIKEAEREVVSSDALSPVPPRSRDSGPDPALAAAQRRAGELEAGLAAAEQEQRLERGRRDKVEAELRGWIKELESQVAGAAPPPPAAGPPAAARAGDQAAREADPGCPIMAVAAKAAAGQHRAAELYAVAMAYAGLEQNEDGYCDGTLDLSLDGPELWELRKQVVYDAFGNSPRQLHPPQRTPHAWRILGADAAAAHRDGMQKAADEIWRKLLVAAEHWRSGREEESTPAHSRGSAAGDPVTWTIENDTNVSFFTKEEDGARRLYCSLSALTAGPQEAHAHLVPRICLVKGVVADALDIGALSVPLPSDPEVAGLLVERVRQLACASDLHYTGPGCGVETFLPPDSGAAAQPGAISGKEIALLLGLPQSLIDRPGVELSCVAGSESCLGHRSMTVTVAHSAGNLVPGTQVVRNDAEKWGDNDPDPPLNPAVVGTGRVRSYDQRTGAVEVDWDGGPRSLARWGRCNVFDVVDLDKKAEAWHVQVQLRLGRPRQALQLSRRLDVVADLVNANAPGLRRIHLRHHWKDRGDRCAAAERLLELLRRSPTLTEVDLGPDPAGDAREALLCQAVAIRCIDNAARADPPLSAPLALHDLRGVCGAQWAEAAALALYDRAELVLPFWDLLLCCPEQATQCSRELRRLVPSDRKPPQGAMLLLCAGVLDRDSAAAVDQLHLQSLTNGGGSSLERDACGRTPLHMACGPRSNNQQHHAAQLAATLHKIDPEAVRRPMMVTRFLPLHVAAKWAATEVVHAVRNLWQGAESEKDYRGHTPAAIALQRASAPPQGAGGAL
eukprot:TRINITY_DN11532_c0_g1_i3.p1 TRINITY_DN11532_c0_g1~~TRINITY_DN11532_c0_g1_i3.p1  ORF type:complete len:1606 (+),score=608.96 TRINITY_DN11532_c0_g1_i3:78-4820(+)